MMFFDHSFPSVLLTKILRHNFLIVIVSDLTFFIFVFSTLINKKEKSPGCSFSRGQSYEVVYTHVDLQE